MKRSAALWYGIFALVLGLGVGGTRPAQAQDAGAVSIAQDNTTFTLDNGLLAAKTNKRSGDVVSLKYHNLEFLEGGNGRSFEKSGTNTLKLTVPASGVTAGIEYDYLRLELDENAVPPPRAAEVPLAPAPLPGNNAEE